VGDHPRAGRDLTIRGRTPGDEPFIVALGTAAFARFGDYAPVMTGFLESPDVAAHIAWTGNDRAGFALVDEPQAAPGFADLVAIAVAPQHRRRGVGRALLGHVIAAREACALPSVLVLTVADDNTAAIALFRSFGFEMVEGSIGRYAGGQVSRRMLKRLRGVAR
jgi:L-phenylalanine/L-methionine N-acetyltransferase